MKSCCLLVSLLASFCLVRVETSSSNSGDQVKKSPLVSTVLNAKWSNVPLVLEVAEFLAEENNQFFWQLIDHLAEEEVNMDKMSDKDIYDQVISFSSRFLSGTQLNLLKFSLSLHTESPRIEMFQQFANDRGVTDLIQNKKSGCGKFIIDLGDKLTCKLEDLNNGGSSKEREKQPKLIKVDHHYPSSALGKDGDDNTVILYAQPGTAGFSEVHTKLKSLAQKGKIDYVLRPYLLQRENRKTRLSGYGVELQIKSSEYKAQDDRKVESDGNSYHDEHEEDGKKDDEVEGFIFNKLNEQNPEDKEKLEEFRQFLLDQKNDMAPLKVWQLQDLSLQTAERVINSPKEKQLKTLIDISQNFPSHARSLSKISVSKELKKEVKKNQETFMMSMNVQPADAALFINGMFYDMDYVDIFTILDALKSEGKILDGLGRLGFTDAQARKLITQDFSSGKTTYGIDIRDTAVNWINNIETDSIYRGWSESVTELLRPTFPGMLRSIRKNFFNVVILCDPSQKESRVLLKLLESFYVHRAPTRIGIVFTVNDDPKLSGLDDAGVAFMNAFNYISSNKEGYDALAFITDVYSKLDDDAEVTVDDVKTQFMENYGADVKMIDVFGEDSEYDVGRQLAKDFAVRTGFKNFPQVLMNGVPLEEKSLNSDEFEEGLMMSLMRVTNEMQKAVYKSSLKDKDDVVDYLMKQPNIMPRLNDRVLKEESHYIDMTGDVLPKLKVDTFTALDKPSMTSTLADNLNYLSLKDDQSKLHIMTVWVVVDLESQQGRDILRGAIAHVKTSSQMRLAVINNSEKPGYISKTVKASLRLLDNGSNKQLLAKILKEDVLKKLIEGSKKVTDYDIPGADLPALAAAIKEIKEDDFTVEKTYCETGLGLTPGQNLVIVNGKMIGPLDKGEIFNVDDFNLLEKFTISQYGEAMVNNYYSFMDLKTPKVSDQAMKTISLLLTRTPGKSRTPLVFHGDKHSVIKIDPEHPDKPSFDITAIIDPTSRGAQKIAPLLATLSEIVNAKISVFMNCVEKHSEMPQKSYFRMVLDAEPGFNSNGALTPGPMARFANLPLQPIFTMHYHIPDNWLIEPVISLYDMDNIKLSAVDEGNVYSEYELEYLLLEGHCFETFSGNPPRGLQLTLGTDRDDVAGDTIVMANLGYLQLKSKPGRWFLKLREGRSSELYDIVSHEGTEEGEGDIPVIIDSFKSKIIKLKVQKKADKRNEELLEGDSSDDEESGGLWNTFTNSLTGGGSDKSSGRDDGKEETLNIFCLASGHLYERLLKIMMLSTIRHTKAPVKFWVLKSYLSPAIKDFLPVYAKKYGFEFEYVQYKWPRWLNQQKEKQRIIWGYKILFLDVMFPLDVKKIIFVDTDQIVRADLTELRDMDLKGAPYGYTPFCDSNKDMEGFRFWKSGYWKNHLAGRPYHISALYVVDLVKFRRIAAGDRLRGQYQALSQDPNSLSNLDQDLPNNMIHQVPIFSLPQEWLYCETWCDKGTLKDAKSIDLCNNPLTKESKLDAARRIVSEWTDYDDEMHKLAEEIRAEMKINSKTQQQQQKEQSRHTEL